MAAIAESESTSPTGTKSRRPPKGKVDAVSFHGGYDPPRISIITDAGHWYGELTEMQVALLVADGSAWLKRVIEAKARG